MCMDKRNEFGETIVYFSQMKRYLRLPKNLQFCELPSTGGLLVNFWVCFEIGTLAFASWSIPVDHSDEKCFHDLLCR